MRFRTCGLSLALAVAFAASARAQEPAQQDEGILVRGAFVTSRPGAKKNGKKDAGTQEPATKDSGGAKLAKNPAGGGGKSGGRKVGAAAVVVSAPGGSGGARLVVFDIRIEHQ